MTYRLSRKAAEDIVNIYVTGVEQFGVEQAEKYHAQLERTFQLIASTPEIARERTEITPPVRIHGFGAHIIVYVVDQNRDVLIVRVRHGHEDWKESPGAE